MAADTARSTALGIGLAAGLVSQTAGLPCGAATARAVFAAVSSACRTDSRPRRATSTTARRERGLGANSETNDPQSGSTQQRKHRSTIHDYLPNLSQKTAQQIGGGRRTILLGQKQSALTTEIRGWRRRGMGDP